MKVEHGARAGASGRVARAEVTALLSRANLTTLEVATMPEVATVPELG